MHQVDHELQSSARERWVLAVAQVAARRRPRNRAARRDRRGRPCCLATRPNPTKRALASNESSWKTKSTVATRSRQLGASRPPWNDADKSRSREARARQQLRVPLRGVPRGTRRHDDIEREQRPARPRRQHAPPPSARMESERTPEQLERRHGVRLTAVGACS